MKNKTKILCTLGPSSMSGDSIRTLSNIGVDIFRINLSHTKIVDLKRQILQIRENTEKSICLDTEGAQIRTGTLTNGLIKLKKGDFIEINIPHKNRSSSNITLYPQEVYDQLEESDILSLDFDAASIIITEKHINGFKAKVLSSGEVGQNKAVTSKRAIRLPSLTKKDKQAIAIGKEMRVDYLALSFASSAKDLIALRDLTNQDTQLIAKIESIDGLNRLDEIIEHSQAILIDRGDLGREVPVESIPLIQKTIINTANNAITPVFVATNLLESMVTRRQPTRAEVNDVVNTLIDGANGLVLAAETAIGNYPIDCVQMISRLIRFSESHSSTDSLQELSTAANLLRKS